MFTFINQVLGPYCKLRTQFFHLRFVALGWKGESVRAKIEKRMSGMSGVRDK